jgi:hypothetical protein
MNQVPTNTCPHCGRNLSTDDLRGQNCPSCGTALPHHARAAQQVALVNQMMGQWGVQAPPMQVGRPYDPHANMNANMNANPYYQNAMNQAHAANAAAAKSMKIIFIVVGAIVGLSLLITLIGVVLAVVLAN